MPPTQLSTFNSSPKRKREQPAHVPLLNTTLRTASTPPRGSPTPSSAPDSPRNEVADQLRGMAITTIPMSPLTPTDDAVRKKPKLEAMREDSGASLENFTESQLKAWELENDQDTTVVKTPEAEGSRVIPETPQSQSQSQSQQQQPRIFADIAAFSRPTTFTSSPGNSFSQKSMTSNQMSKSRSRSLQPRQRIKSPSPPLSSLTWQDDEITGHLVDPFTDPEDDGTGLNGIGFKPTPALAYARAQRRRQQLMDWRAREAREARAKRSERRRRGVGTGTPSRETTVEREVTVHDADAMRRTVKFAI